MKSGNKKQQKISYRNGWGEVVTMIIDRNYLGCDDQEVLNQAATDLAADLGITVDAAYVAITTPVA